MLHKNLGSRVSGCESFSKMEGGILRDPGNKSVVTRNCHPSHATRMAVGCNGSKVYSVLEPCNEQYRVHHAVLIQTKGLVRARSIRSVVVLLFGCFTRHS